MAFNARILGLLESELSKQLTFSFTGDASRANQVNQLQDQSVFRFTVTVRNDSAFTLNNVRGFVEPTKYSKFAPVDFKLSSLAPGECRTVVSVVAQIVGRPSQGVLADHVGSVSVSASADLCSIEFQEWNKPLSHAQPSRELADTTHGLKVGNRRRLSQPQPLVGIPLSDTE